MENLVPVHDGGMTERESGRGTENVSGRGGVRWSSGRESVRGNASGRGRSATK